MDVLQLFGLFAVTAMLVCYALKTAATGMFSASQSPARSFGLRFSAGRLAVRAGRGGLGRRRAAALECQAAMTSPFWFRQAVNPSSALYRCALRRWMKSVSTPDWA